MLAQPCSPTLLSQNWGRRPMGLLLPTSPSLRFGNLPDTPAVFSPDAHSLCLDLTVKPQSRPGQPWCQAQGSVDTKPFLQYDSDSNKVKPLGVLGKEVNDTKAWTELSQTLGEAGRELRMVLPVIKLDTKEPRGKCGKGVGSWRLLNGRTALLLDTMSITWTVIDPGATGIQEEWENNRELAEYFRKISTGDCSYWLREFLELWENMLLLEPTGS
uniref:MHC class I-like antigen recognition-like domain-containing protein n=1 Tax=Moschus moschiferus TaxID=68415 RepID=A0A8C6CR06_MOSMO